MRRAEFAGTGNVFRFTLAQYLKAPSTIVTMLIMVVAVIASVFIAGYSMNEGTEIAAGNIQTLNIINRTGIPIDAGDIAACDGYFIGITETDPGNADAILTIDITDAGYAITATGDNTEEYARMRLESAALSAFELARAGAKPYSSRALTMDEFTGAVQPEDDDYAASFTVSYVYSILVLMLVMLSSTYIIRSVLEEKASRLVETLMVSVSPMALIVGKILASMCLVVVQLALILGGGYGAMKLIGHLGGNIDAVQMVTATGAMSALAGLDLPVLIAAIISIILGFMTFALISGLSASCCSNMEDINTASTATIFSALAGYLAAMAASGLGETGAALFSMVPFVSVFAAPVKFLEGHIGIGVLLVAWALQLGVIALLAIICRKTYASLIMHKGSRVKLRELLKMAGIGGGRA